MAATARTAPAAVAAGQLTPPELPQRVDGPGHRHIARRKAAGIVGGKAYVHPVPHVRPFGVMIVFFSQQRHPHHEGERLRKIREAEAALQMLALQLPARQFGCQRLPRLCSQLLDHRPILA